MSDTFMHGLTRHREHQACWAPPEHSTQCSQCLWSGTTCLTWLSEDPYRLCYTKTVHTWHTLALPDGQVEPWPARAWSTSSMLSASCVVNTGPSTPAASAPLSFRFFLDDAFLLWSLLERKLMAAFVKLLPATWQQHSRSCFLPPVVANSIVS